MDKHVMDIKKDVHIIITHKTHMFKKIHKYNKKKRNLMMILSNINQSNIFKFMMEILKLYIIPKLMSMIKNL